MTPALPGMHRFGRNLRYALVLLIGLLFSACTHLAKAPLPTDPAAEQLAATLRATNHGLTAFRCVGKMTLAGPNTPPHAFRVAMAGQLGNRLRIDMLAPFGGSTGSLASDGHHLYVVMHASRDYYRRGFGSGSLERLIGLDVGVGELLAFMVGRIPLDAEQTAHLQPATDTDLPSLEMRDSRGRIRQRLSLDAALAPTQAVWYDWRQQMTHNLQLFGSQQVGGFNLPRRIDMVGQNGRQVSLVLERYAANPMLEEQMFRLENPWP